MTALNVITNENRRLDFLAAQRWSLERILGLIHLSVQLTNSVLSTSQESLSTLSDII